MCSRWFCVMNRNIGLTFYFHGWLAPESAELNPTILRIRCHFTHSTLFAKRVSGCLKIVLYHLARIDVAGWFELFDLLLQNKIEIPILYSVEAQNDCCLWSRPPVFVHAYLVDVTDILWRSSIERLVLLLAYPFNKLLLSLGKERNIWSTHLTNHAAEAPHITLEVIAASLEDFGRHVEWRAYSREGLHGLTW